MTEIDSRALRNAFGSFMTGVTVVTTLDSTGVPLGFTANSFTSVSLDPPLVLVCLANRSSNFEAFSKAKGFAVNILSATQKEVSNTFASQVNEANALYNNTNLIVSALIEFDGKIFLNQNADGKLVLPETKVGKDGASRALKRLVSPPNPDLFILFTETYRVTRDIFHSYAKRIATPPRKGHSPNFRPKCWHKPPSPLSEPCWSGSQKKAKWVISGYITAIRSEAKSIN